MPITLIPATLAHAPLLSGMHAVGFAEPWSETSMAETLSMPGAAGRLAVDGASLVPATAPPGPAGFVLWRTGGGEAEILSLMVLPPWRRTGLGSRLMKAAAAECARSARILFLEVAADNSGAQALYRALGFAAVGRRRGYYGSVDALVLSLELG